MLSRLTSHSETSFLFFTRRRDSFKAASHCHAILHAIAIHNGFGQQVLLVVVFLPINQPKWFVPTRNHLIRNHGGHPCRPTITLRRRSLCKHTSRCGWFCVSYQALRHIVKDANHWKHKLKWYLHCRTYSNCLKEFPRCARAPILVEDREICQFIPLLQKTSKSKCLLYNNQ